MPKSATHLNILFLIMDDQRPDTVGAEDGFPVDTPNLDALAASGIHFRRHYVTTPICTPGRAEVLTGHHSYHNGVRWFGRPIRSDLPLMPRWFRDHGYHTIHVGKWHNDGHPRDKGYDVVRRSMGDSLLPYLEHGHEMAWEEGGREIRGHSTEVFCEAALEEIAAAPGDKPWFCYLALHSPHDPFDCTETFLPEEAPPVPDNFIPVYPWDNGDLTIRDELLLPHPRSPEAVREYRRRYAAMIRHHDHHLGRVLDAVDDNTLVVFTSDHGLAVGDHGLLGKENMHEHSCRIPLLLKGPGVEAGREVQNLTHHVDLFPTLCSLAGLEAPDCDGRALPDAPSREFLCCGFTSPDPDPDRPLRETQRMIVTDEWKYLWYPISGHEALYHLPTDPAEADNLLASWRCEPYPQWKYEPPRSRDEVEAVAHRLRAQLRDWGRENGDPLFP